MAFFFMAISYLGFNQELSFNAIGRKLLNINLTGNVSRNLQI